MHGEIKYEHTFIGKLEEKRTIGRCNLWFEIVLKFIRKKRVLRVYILSLRDQ